MRRNEVRDPRERSSIGCVARARLGAVSSESVRSAAAEEFLVAAGFWLDAFDRDRRRLIDAAVGVLVADLDSPALRELAGLYGDEEWELVDRLVRAAASELGLPRPSASRAVRIELARRCREILAGRASARTLAVWAETVDGPMRGDGRFLDLRAFVAFEWEYEELDDIADFADAAVIAEDRARLDAAVREEARRAARSGDCGDELSGHLENRP